MKNQNQLPKDLLDRNGIIYSERNNELIAKCIFNDCDSDSRPNEAHLYISAETGQYHCKKCGKGGGLSKLAEQLGDTALQINKPDSLKKEIFTEELIVQCNNDLPQAERKWLNDRGITDESIADFQLGYGKFYGQYWITIPIKDSAGDSQFFKLRRLPSDEEESVNPNKYMFWPKGSKSALFNSQNISQNETMMYVCEGEFDCILAHQYGIPAATSTAGAGTFDAEWLSGYKNLEKLYIGFDKDEAGQNGATTLVEKVSTRYTAISIYQISLPDELPEGADLTDFLNNGGSPNELFDTLAKLVAGQAPIDVSKFEPMSTQNVLEVLGLTIKQDEDNKLVTFLCQLSAYTEDSQLNLSFNAPSSSGKSFLPIEIARLFPQEDILELGYVSPTSFFHSSSQYNKDTQEYLVDLSSKVIVFLDQPHNMLLEHLRPLLSHDKKEIKVQITDKQQKNGLRAKKIVLRGYPAVIFCSAGLRMDEQEATRFLLLSPELSQEKIREGIIESLKKSVNRDAYELKLDENPDRRLLKERIIAIKRAGITDIRIEDEVYIQQHFFDTRKILKPRHQRDIKRLVSLVKVLALLNLWWRELDGTVIHATKEDIEEAFRLWDKISYTQELNIPPYIFRLYEEIILPAFEDKNGSRSEDFVEITGEIGVSRQELMKKHFEVYGRSIDPITLRQQILPMLNQAGLVNEEVDPSNKRSKLIYPQQPGQYSESSGGVNNSEERDKIIDTVEEIFGKDANLEDTQESIDFGKKD